MTEKTLKVEEDKLYLDIKQPQMDIVINNLVELHITQKLDRVIVDGYIYRTDEELESDDHDPDEDYIDSIEYEVE